LLLHGAKRNEVLTLEEVERYGRESFGDPDYVSIYGMRPAEWYARGIRLLGRTAVECTRDVLGDAIGQTIAANIAQLAPARVLVIDPFAGSCNTLSWILEHVPGAEGLAFELDARVSELTRHNLALLGRPIEMIEADSLSTLLSGGPLPSDRALLFFIAPPWGTALDEKKGRLDLRRTTPPVTGILASLSARYASQPLMFAVQVYQKLDRTSFEEAVALLDHSRLRIFGFNEPGRNHGILVGTCRWSPRPR
jgi:hypothetical protein